MDLAKIIDWICNRDNITFVIAVAGFAMSVWNFAEAFLRRRVRLRVDFAHVFRVEGGERCVDILHLKVFNLSGRAVIVSRLTVEHDIDFADFGTYRRQLLRSERASRHSSGETVRTEQTWMSDHLPIQIEGGGFANLMLIADLDGQHISLRRVNLVKLYTPFGIIRKKLVLSDFSDRKLLGECRAPD